MSYPLLSFLIGAAMVRRPLKLGLSTVHGTGARKRSLAGPLQAEMEFDSDDDFPLWACCCG